MKRIILTHNPGDIDDEFAKELISNADSIFNTEKSGVINRMIGHECIYISSVPSTCIIGVSLNNGSELFNITNDPNTMIAASLTKGTRTVKARRIKDLVQDNTVCFLMDDTAEGMEWLITEHNNLGVFESEDYDG